MNLKLCKKLRKMARGMTVGKPAVQYWPLDNRSTKAGIFERLELFPECTRAVYHKLKETFRHGSKKAADRALRPEVRAAVRADAGNVVGPPEDAAAGAAAQLPEGAG